MELVAEQPRSRLATLGTNSVLWGGLLGLIALNVSTARPVWGIDSSFRVGLTEAITRGMSFGDDVVWPYGPLGFLAGPTFLNRGLLAIAVLWQLALLTAMFTALVHHLGRLGLSRLWTVVLLAPVALAISVTENMVAEVGSLAVVVVLVVLWQDDGPSLPAPSTWWVVAIAGFVAGSELLVKIGPGALACGVVLAFAVSAGDRARQAVVALVAIAAGFLVAWVLTGQSLSDIGAYITTGLDASSGYQDAQAFDPSSRKVRIVGLLALVITAIGVYGAIRWARRDRAALWALIPLGFATWFFLKQGLVRWDSAHVASAVLLVALLVTCIPWDRQRIALPIGVLLVAAAVGFVMAPSELKDTVPDRAEVALVLLSSQAQADRIESAKQDLQAEYALPEPVVEALADGNAHAEPWDSNALWAYDIEWNPVPVLQSYAAYTADLDQINADRYAADDGPDGVLMLLTDNTVDSRYALWESPQAQLALTCNFEVAAVSPDWAALRRRADACGPARDLGTVRVEPGETVAVPTPSSESSIVVGYFELPDDPIGRLTSMIARPTGFPHVTVDDDSYRLVPGHAGNAHILRSPGQVDGRELPHGVVQHDTLSFSNVGSGAVVVRFEEIPLTTQ